MSLHRFFGHGAVPEGPDSFELPLSPSDIHHAVDVLRLRPTERIALAMPEAGRVFEIALTQVNAEGLHGEVASMGTPFGTIRGEAGRAGDPGQSGMLARVAPCTEPRGHGHLSGGVDGTGLIGEPAEELGHCPFAVGNDSLQHGSRRARFPEQCGDRTAPAAGYRKRQPKRRCVDLLDELLG